MTRTTDRITALYNRDGELTSEMPAIRRRMQEIYASESAAPDPDHCRASDFFGMRSELLRWFAWYIVGEASEQPFLIAWTDILNGILMHGDGRPHP